MSKGLKELALILCAAKGAVTIVMANKVFQRA